MDKVTNLLQTHLLYNFKHSFRLDLIKQILSRMSKLIPKRLRKLGQQHYRLACLMTPLMKKWAIFTFMGWCGLVFLLKCGFIYGCSICSLFHVYIWVSNMLVKFYLPSLFIFTPNDHFMLFHTSSPNFRVTLFDLVVMLTFFFFISFVFTPTFSFICVFWSLPTRYIY